MSEPKEHLDNICEQVTLLNEHNHVVQADELVALNELEVAVHNVRKSHEQLSIASCNVCRVFNRYKNNQSGGNSK